MSNDLIELQYCLTFTTPFHFGTGLREGLLDRSVRRNTDGHLYVPGSTLKGVIREYCEQLCRFIDPADKRISSPHDDISALIDLYTPGDTLITHIFGSHNQAGLLFFDNALQSPEEIELYNGSDSSQAEGKYKSMQTTAYTQVRIDRQTHTAVQGALYTSEFGRSNFSFTGTISGWLQHTAIEQQKGVSQEILLLLAGLLMIERLGGNKSTGKGACINEITSLKINGGEAIGKDEWSHWLDHLDQLVISGGAEA